MHHASPFRARAWNTLAEEAPSSVFIAGVDCGASYEKEICRNSDITAYPTLRYYLGGTEHDYTGSLSLDALRDFVGSTLVAPCNPLSRVSTCSEKAKQYAEKWIAKDADKLLKEIERLGTMMKTSEASAKAELRRWMRERRDILSILHEHKMQSGDSEL